MQIFTLAASLRQQSTNKLLINFTNELLSKKNYKVGTNNFSDFDAPLYNQDIEINQGLPTGIKDFIEKIAKADGIIFSIPEYNYSIPGSFKNLIDWASRYRPSPWKGKKILLMSASPSAVGGNRGLWATRIPLEGCGAFVFPEMFSLAESHKNINDKGEITNTDLVTRLNTLLNDFLSFAKK